MSIEKLILIFLGVFSLVKIFSIAKATKIIADKAKEEAKKNQSND